MFQVLDAYSLELQKKFLLFTTGSDRVPVGGMGEMTFKITKMTQKLKNGESKQKLVNLPEAHTCFNQLVLPGIILNDVILYFFKNWPQGLKFFRKKRCILKRAEQYFLIWLLHAIKMQNFLSKACYVMVTKHFLKICFSSL